MKFEGRDVFSIDNLVESPKRGCIPRGNLGEWQHECRQALMQIYRAAEAGSGSTTSLFYIWLLEAKCDGDLKTTLGLEKIN